MLKVFYILCCLWHIQAFAQAKPNVVFILSDDMGYGDIQAYNSKSKIPTPHLNQLAKDGIAFTDAHAAGSVCVPSRYGLITGRYPIRAPHMRSKNGPVIAEGRSTIASLLRDQGYETKMVGKWHLGFEMQQQGSKFVFDYTRDLKGGPIDFGFNSYFGMHASLDIPPYFFIKNRSVVLPPTNHINARDSMNTDEGWNKIQGAFWREGPVSPDFKHEEITPRFKNEAIQVIQQYAQGEKEKPMFLYLALPSPHTPWLPLPKFRGKSGAGMYGDFVMQIDDVVGQVRDALRKNGLSENTLIFFSSDNGPVWYDKDREKFSHDSVGGLKGMKFSPHEGGHRVPFLVSWPNKIKAGQICQNTISFVDLYATLAELTGATHMRQKAGEDSHSFYASLINPQKFQFREPILHDLQTIRFGDFKLIQPKKKQGRPMLFNLKHDLGEHSDLASQQPHKVNELKAKFKKLFP
jgi:arylsulfatase A-like enzyme